MKDNDPHETEAKLLADQEAHMTAIPNSAFRSFADLQRAEHRNATARAQYRGTPLPTPLNLGAAANYLTRMDDDWVANLTSVPAAAFRASFAAVVAEHGPAAALDLLDDLFPSCTWMVRRGYDEDGGEIIRDCGADVTFTQTGWSCEAGHDYVDMETRHAEGWDYAADEGEAALLRKYGTDVVGMDGGSI